MENNELFCPRCKGHNIVTGQKGFSVGKAVAGGVLLGPLGLLAGTHKSKDIRFVCLDCGNRFSVDELLEVKARICRADNMIAKMKEERKMEEERRANLTEEERMEEDRRKQEELEREEKSNQIFMYCLIGVAVIFLGVIIWLVAIS